MRFVRFFQPGQSLVPRYHGFLEGVGFGPVGVGVHGHSHYWNAPGCHVGWDGGDISSDEKTENAEVSFEEGPFHCVAYFGDTIIFEELKK